MAITKLWLKQMLSSRPARFAPVVIALTLFSIGESVMTDTCALVDFSAPAIGAAARAQSLDFSQDQQGMTLNLVPGSDEALVLTIPDDIGERDWTTFDTLALELANPDARELIVVVTLREESGSVDRRKHSWFTARLAPGKHTWNIPIQHLRYTEIWGWPWGYPSQPGISEFASGGRLNTYQIAEVAISIRRADDDTDAKRSLVLHRLSLENPITSRGWVDQYGQRSNANWPDKVKNDEDLKQADEREARELAQAKPYPGRDEYQAWADGPMLEATGFFRVEQVDGRWWFVAPNGRLFFAIGIDCVGVGADGPQNDLVPEAYSWRPVTESEFEQAWSSKFHGTTKWNLEGGLSLYRANLIRKWGPEGLGEKGRERAVLRQLAWGFTCYGNWTDGKLLQEARLPYFTTGPDMSLVTIPHISSHIMDVYDPEFEAQAREAAALLAKVKDDPLVVGHFVDNEIGWREFSRELVKLPADRPARVEMSRFLQKRYGDIGGLNTAWGTAAASFDELPWPAPNHEQAEADVAVFRGEFADRYYRIWAQVIREVDPNHLVLGSRMHGGNRPPEVVAACARHMDVVSFNNYDYGPRAEEFNGLYELAQKPFIIGEYGFNSLDEGLLAAAVPVADQAERGVGYRYYTEQLAALSYFVGGHYFQYLDEPITGRFDTECSFNGFVRVTDIPYPILVEATKTSNARIYEVHAGKVEPFERRPRR